MHAEPTAGRGLGPGLYVWLRLCTGDMVPPLLPAFLRDQSSPTQTMASTFTQKSQGTSDQIKVRSVKDWLTLPPELFTKHIWLELCSPMPSNQQVCDRAGQVSGQWQTANKPPAQPPHPGHLSARHCPKAVTVPIPATWSSTSNVLHTCSRDSQESRPAWSKKSCHVPQTILAHLNRAHSSQGSASSLSGAVLVCQPCKSLGCSILTNSTLVNAERTQHMLQGYLHLAQLGSFPLPNPSWYGRRAHSPGATPDQVMG